MGHAIHVFHDSSRRRIQLSCRRRLEMTTLFGFRRRDHVVNVEVFGWLGTAHKKGCSVTALTWGPVSSCGSDMFMVGTVKQQNFVLSL